MALPNNPIQKLITIYNSLKSNYLFAKWTSSYSTYRKSWLLVKTKHTTSQNNKIWFLSCGKVTKWVTVHRASYKVIYSSNMENEKLLNYNYMPKMIILFDQNWHVHVPIRFLHACGFFYKFIIDS
jgi:hypothetical protein